MRFPLPVTSCAHVGPQHSDPRLAGSIACGGWEASRSLAKRKSPCAPPSAGLAASCPTTGQRRASTGEGGAQAQGSKHGTRTRAPSVMWAAATRPRRLASAAAPHPTSRPAPVCSIIYDMGKPSESFEWFKIRGAAPEACQLQDERVDFAKLALPAGAAGAAGGGAKAQRAAAANCGAARGAGAAAGAAGAKQQAAGSRQQPAAARQGAGASKAGAPRAAGTTKPTAGAGKPAAARTAAAAPVAAKPAAPMQQQPQQQPGQPGAAAATAAAPQQPARNGKTHHAHLANGLSSHAAAVKQALAAGARPPYHLNAHALLPRR